MGKFNEKIPPFVPKEDLKKNIEKMPILEKKLNEKNPTPEEMLVKEKRRVARLMELLRQHGIEIDESYFDDEK
jgi:hypothetical protein